MNKLKDIRSFADLKEFAILNKEFIKKAALPLVVVAALIFFRIYGAEEDTVSENIDDISTPDVEQADPDADVEDPEPSVIYVDISGCVVNPGVYEAEPGMRIFQMIEMAGGTTEDADTDSINRAEEVYDGQKIMIYPAESGPESSGISSGTVGDGRININTADFGQLQDIPGVGPVTAEKIIEYRENNGRFSDIEELKEISGIGDKTFEEMIEYITV